ncbi:MAG: helix-turn-helix domain-containing protein [Pseudonocardia sp.]|nr:helix-turn-helix domain-containing protein [Pseudonocardia sp.]
MGYRELRAPAALAGLVECGWVDTPAADAPHDVLPDGCMDLVWTGAQLLVAGPDTVAQPGRRIRGMTVAGLRFLPGALPSLLNVPAAALHNHRVALAELLPGPSREAVARLESGEEAITVLTALAIGLPGAAPDRSVAALRGALSPARSASPSNAAAGAGRAASGVDLDLAVGACAEPLGPHGSVAELADALGCTPRSVHRRCLTAFGYGPAVLRRVLRFRRAAAMLRAGVPAAEVAAAAGYADQPHLSRETRAFAGASPGQLAGAKRSTPLPSGSSTTA